MCREITEGEYQAYYDPVLDPMKLPQKQWIWTTRNGEKIPITELEDSHLWNILRLLKRRAPRLLFFEQLRCALSGRMFHGEIAQETHEQVMDELLEMDPMEYLLAQPLFKALCWEAVERGLISSDGLDE